MGMENMGFVGGYVNTGEALARMEEQKSLTAERLQMMKMRDFTLNQEMATRDAMMKASAANNSPDASIPSPEEIAAKEGSDSPFSLKAGGIGMGSEGPKISDMHKQAAKTATAEAKAIETAGGNPAKAAALRKDAEAALTHASTAEKEERAAQVQRFETMRNLFGAAKDELSLNDVVIPQAKAEFGADAVDKFLKTAPLDRDPASGRFSWTERNKKIVESLADSALKQVEREKEKDKAEDRIRKQQEADRRAEDSADNARHRRTMEELKQQGMTISAEVKKQATQLQRDKMARKTETTAQASLEKDPVYRDYSKYELSQDLADNLKKQLSDPNVKSINASDARAVSLAYLNMAEGYRSRAGGKYALEDVAKFNGLAQKLNKWWESIGQGTPALDVSTARDVANTITELGDIANKNVVISSLDAMERVANDKGNPDKIRFKGNIDRLKAIKQITHETKTTDKGIFEVYKVGNRTFTFKRDEEE